MGGGGRDYLVLAEWWVMVDDSTIFCLINNATNLH